MTLAEALAQVQLEPGQTYACSVNGKQVTVRVAPKDAPLAVSRYNESDVMLDAWCDLPSQGTPTRVLKVTPGTLPIDIPYIPQDDVE
jgi:hypothetical protein